MSFNLPVSNVIPQVPAGTVFGKNNDIFSTDNYADGLYIGRFANQDPIDGALYNWLDGVGALIAGVVLNSTSFTPNTLVISDDAFAPSKKPQSIDFINSGIVAVQVKTGDTPDPYNDVFIENGLVDRGTATTLNTQRPANAIFLREISTGIWLIRIR